MAIAQKSRCFFEPKVRTSGITLILHFFGDPKNDLWCQNKPYDKLCKVQYLETETLGSVTAPVAPNWVGHWAVAWKWLWSRGRCPFPKTIWVAKRETSNLMSCATWKSSDIGIEIHRYSWFFGWNWRKPWVLLDQILVKGQPTSTMFLSDFFLTMYKLVAWWWKNPPFNLQQRIQHNIMYRSKASWSIGIKPTNMFFLMSTSFSITLTIDDYTSIKSIGFIFLIIFVYRKMVTTLARFTKDNQDPLRHNAKGLTSNGRVQRW